MRSKTTILCTLAILAVSLWNIPAVASESILTVHMTEKGQLAKARTGSREYDRRVTQAVQSTSLDVFEYRGFTVYLNRVTNKNFEVQVFRPVTYGKMEIKSIFSSQYQLSVDYVYTYDAQTREIRQNHFVFPPNSLTGWADPENFALLRRFDWREKFPVGSCESPIYTSEEYGREYLQAACFPNRDHAFRFAKKFILYVTGRRNL